MLPLKKKAAITLRFQTDKVLNPGFCCSGSLSETIFFLCVFQSLDSSRLLPPIVTMVLLQPPKKDKQSYDGEIIMR